MMTMTQMYWLTRLDSLCGMFVFVFAVSLLMAAVLAAVGIALRSEHDVTQREWKTGRGLHVRVVPICLAISLLAGVLRSLTPTTAEMAAIIVVPKIANNEKVQDVGNRLYDLAVEWTDELRPRKKKEEGR